MTMLIETSLEAMMSPRLLENLEGLGHKIEVPAGVDSDNLMSLKNVPLFCHILQSMYRYFLIYCVKLF